MNKEEIELALKLTEIRFKNYTFEDHVEAYEDVLSFFEDTLAKIKEERWLE